MAKSSPKQLWKDDREPFNHIKPGFLGANRKGMYDNFLLFKPKLGKAHLPPLKGLPKDFTFGNSYKDPFTVSHALCGWAGVPPLVPIPPEKPKPEPGPDKMNFNRAAVHRRIFKGDELRDFKDTHRLDFHDRSSPTVPRIKVDPNYSHGVPVKRDDPPMCNLLSSKYQDDWIKNNYKNVKAKHLKREEAILVYRKDYRFVPETRTTQLRMHMKETDVPQPLWKMSKFEKKAKPQISTFRSEAALNAAHKDVQHTKL